MIRPHSERGEQWLSFQTRPDLIENQRRGLNPGPSALFYLLRLSSINFKNPQRNIIVFISAPVLVKRVSMRVLKKTEVSAFPITKASAKSFVLHLSPTTHPVPSSKGRKPDHSHAPRSPCCLRATSREPYENLADCALSRADPQQW